MNVDEILALPAERGHRDDNARPATARRHHFDSSIVAHASGRAWTLSSGDRWYNAAVAADGGRDVTFYALERNEVLK